MAGRAVADTLGGIPGRATPRTADAARGTVIILTSGDWN